MLPSGDVIQISPGETAFVEQRSPFRSVFILSFPAGIKRLPPVTISSGKTLQRIVFPNPAVT
jgi:hypothetical protein